MVRLFWNDDINLNTCLLEIWSLGFLLLLNSIKFHFGIILFIEDTIFVDHNINAVSNHKHHNWCGFENILHHYNMLNFKIASVEVLNIMLVYWYCQYYYLLYVMTAVRHEAQVGNDVKFTIEWQFYFRSHKSIWVP